MTTTEDRLRAALRSSAQEVTDDDPPPYVAPTPRRRTVVAPLLVAAAVLAVAVSVAVAVSSRHPHTSQPVPTETLTGWPPAQGLTCTVPLPASWGTALRTHTVSVAQDAVDPPGPQLLAVTDDGDAVVEQATGPHDPVLVLVGPDGATRTLYSAGVSGGISAATSSDGWVVFVQNGDAGADEIDAVDLRTGRVVPVRDGSVEGDPNVSPPVLVRDVVYWAERRTLYSFDLATRTKTVVDTGDIVGPVAAGDTVAWGNGAATKTVGGAPLPAGFVVTAGFTSSETTSEATGTSTHGTTTAWTASETGHAAIRVTSPYGRRQLVEHVDTTDPLGVAGPYVLWAGTHVLDTRTGASTTLPAEIAADGYLAGGGSIVTSNSDAVAVVPATDLPELHC